MKSSVTLALFLALASLMIANRAHALPERIVSASFFEPFLFPQSGPMLPTAIAGVPNFFHGGPADVRVPHWNQLQGPFGIELDLFDSQGFGTTVDARWIATDVASNNYLNPFINGDSMMMNGHLFSSTLGAIGLASVTVQDLGATFDIASGYEVWVYADPEGLGQIESLFVDDGIHVGMAITITDTVTDLAGGRQFDFTTDYDEATTDGLGVWVRFTGLTGPTFTIEARSLLVGQSAYINGFQIIGVGLVPEPSSFLVAFSGMIALCGFRCHARNR